MKRLGVLCVLATALALPLMAAPITVTGDLTAGWIGSFGAAAAYAGDVNLNFKAAVDDYSSVAITVGRALKTFVTDATVPTSATFEDMVLDAATLTIDAGKFAGLDPKTLAWTVVAGYTSAADNSYVSQSGYGVEDVGGAGTATAWMGYTTFKLMDLVSLKIGVVPATMVTGTYVDMIAGIYMSKVLKVGTFSAEAFWDNADELIVADARFDLTQKNMTVGVGAGMNYDMTAPAAWKIGASVKGSYAKMGDLALGFVYASAAAELLAVQATVIAAQPFDFYAGAKFDVSAGAANVFHSADFAAKLNLGVADIYVGYSLGNGVVAPTVRWAPVALGLDGGLYVKFYIAF